MAKSKLPRARLEGVTPENISHRLVGDDLDLSIAAIEIIILHDRFGFLHRPAARSDANRFEAIPISFGAVSEEVIINPGVIRGCARPQPNGKSHAFMIHPGERAMIHSVV